MSSTSYNWRKMISLLLVAALVWTMMPISISTVHGAEVETVTSSNLTLNGNTTEWTLEGGWPATLHDSNYGLNFYDDDAFQIALRAEATGLNPGVYVLKVKVYGDQDTNNGSMIFAQSDGERFETVLDYTGSSWGEPPNWRTLELNEIVVGEAGTATVGFEIKGNAGHWGHLHDAQLMPVLPEGSVESIKLAPSSINLRPGKSVQLRTTVLPEEAANKSVTYTSSNESVATVDASGMVTATGNGNASITAVAQDGSGTTGRMQLTVSDQEQLYGDAKVQVEPVAELQDGQREDFIMGVDISTVYEIERSGRKYYDLNGEEKPLMEIFQENGVNWIRLRLWNDPKDENGVWYGAGNTDKERVIAMAQQAKSYGLKVLIDFHYSDFWADPGHQHKPKAWRNLTDEQLQQAVYDYTYEVIDALAEAGAYPDMVQIGNEINTGMLHPTGNSPANAKPFIAEGINAVRAAELASGGAHIDIMLHRANPEHGVSTVRSFFSNYSDLDYDVIGLSYYPFWHGSFENVQAVMDEMATYFNKKVVIAETSYGYTLASDSKNGIGNIFGPNQEADGGYQASVAGQATAIRDVISAVAKVPDGKGLGIFYWEPAWLPGVDTGWASVEGAAYTNVTIAGAEGSGWSNQAMFNFYGEALPSIQVYDLVRASGEDYEEPTIVSISPVQVRTSEGVYVALPSSVPALYSDGKYRQVAVESWTPETYNVNAAGSYSSQGTLSGGGEVVVNITVTPKNYVVNPGIESPDMSAWVLFNSSRTGEAPYTGSYAIHFWNRDLITVKQTITGLSDGVYRLSMYSRIGGDPIGDSYMYAINGDEELKSTLTMSGWSNWNLNRINDIEVRGGTLEIGAVVNQSINAGGDFDDWELIKVGELEPETTPTPTPTSTNGTTPTPTPTPVPSPTPSNSGDNLGSIQAGGQLNASGQWIAGVDSAQLALALEEAAVGKGGVKTVTIRTNDSGASAGTILNLPLQALAAGDNVQYKIITSLGAVTLPGHMLDAGIFAGGTEQIGLQISKGDISGLSESLQEAIGSRPVIDVQLLLDGQSIGWSNASAPVTISIPYSRAEQGELRDGYIVIWYIDENGQAIAVPNARYMADEGTVTFSTTHFSLYAVAKVNKQFADMAGYAWAETAVNAMAAGGAVLGVGQDRFAPELHVKRADFVVMLARALGLTAQWDAGFHDVPADAYYADAVGIAKQLGIATGTGNDLFEPERAVTRQEIMVLTARALRAAGRLDSVSNEHVLSSYADRDEVAEFAEADAALLVEAGVIQGKGDRIAPTATATRAEAAVMIYRAMYLN